MAQPIDPIIERRVSSLTEAPPSTRRAMLEGPITAEAHRVHFDAIPALREIEVGGESGARTAGGPIRIAAWNVERLRDVDAVAETLRRLDPDVVLLSEVDKGMARSGNRHGLAELARTFGHAFAYGVEFVELGPGNPEEARTNHDGDNLFGFHGNAVMSRLQLNRPFMIRLEADGGWFGPERGERRVGGRMAIGAQIAIDGQSVTVVSAHLESNSTPDGRAAQMRVLLDALDAYDPAAPVLVGGDFNTSTLDRTRDRDVEFQAAALARDPRRLIAVQPYEPLFNILEQRGFDWRDANDLETPTERPQQGAPDRPRGKIDWIFARGLRAEAPATTPALRPDGSVISDHDCLSVSISLPAV